MSETEAIEGAKQGDSGCFEALYAMHKRRVYSLCLRMTRNVEEAEDLTQDAFLQLYRKIASYRGESAFSTWLHRLAVNTVLMHMRKKVLPEISLDEDLASEEEEGPRKEYGVQDVALTGAVDRVNLERAIDRPSPWLSNRLRAARCGRIRAQRDCRDDGMLHWQQQIAASQGADEATF